MSADSFFLDRILIVFICTSREVLPHAIDALQGAGYRLVTVAECLGAQPYTNVRRPEPRDVRVLESIRY